MEVTQGGLVDPQIWTFILQLANTFILFLLLKKFLFKPVTEFMNNRSNEIEESIKLAKTKNEEADSLKVEYQTKIEGSEDEGRQLIREAAKKAEDRASGIVKAAQEEATEIKDRSKLEIEREKEKAINSLKDDIASIAMLAATKVVEADIDEKKHMNLVNKFIDEVGEAKWQN